MNISSSLAGATSSLTAMRWLLPEINVELRAIEALLDSPQNRAEAGVEASDRLWQIGNLLAMAELAPPAALCHDLARTLTANQFSLPSRELALEISLRLPELIMDATRDDPGTLALIWVLRADLHQLAGLPALAPPPLPDAQPTLVALSAQQLERYPDERFLPLAAKLHTTYRDALLHCQQADDPTAALRELNRVVIKLLEVAPQSPTSPILSALEQILAAVQQERLKPHPALLDALAELEPWLARLAMTGAALLNQPPELLARLHPYAQLAGPSGSKGAVQSSLLPGSGAGAAQQVLLGEVATEIDQIKTQLEDDANFALLPLQQSCQRLLAITNLLALPHLTHAMQRVVDLVMTDPATFDRLALAEALLELEAQVMEPDCADAVSQQQNLGLHRAQRQFLQQCALELEELRLLLDDHLALPDNGAIPARVEQGLRQLQGAFSLMEWPELAAATSSVERQLLTTPLPEQSRMMQIVDLLVGIEIYLQQWLAGECDAPPHRLINLCRHINGDTEQQAEISAPASLEADNAAEDDFDSEITAIFVEEAQEVLATMAAHWSAFNAGERNAVIEVRRGFHTLKGSGRMVAAAAVAELAWAVEHRLNRLLDLGNPIDAELVELIAEARNLLPELLDCFANKRSPSSQWQQLLQQLDGSAPTAKAVDLKPQTEPRPIATAPAPEETLDTIFMREATGHLERIGQILPQISEQGGDWLLLERTLHTLKGSANAANRQPLAQLVGAMLDAVHGHLQDGGDAPLWPCRAAAELLPLLLTLSGPTLETTLPPQFNQLIGLLKQQTAELQPALPTDWIDLANNLLLALENPDVDSQQSQQQMAQALTAIQAEPMPAAIHGWVENFSHWWQTHYRADRIEARARLALCRQALIETIEAAVLGQPAADWSELWQPLPEPQRQESTLERAFATPQSGKNRAAPAAPADTEMDEELLTIFLGEAEELLEEIQSIQSSWLDHPATAPEQAASLARVLHTLKGGARLVGYQSLADICHQFETRLDAQQSIQIDPAELTALIQQLQAMISTGTAAEVAMLAPASPEPSETPAVWTTTDSASTVESAAVESVITPEAAKAAARGETLKMSTTLLAHLLDLTNESTLAQGRIERQSREFGQSIDEMELTIDRLRDQLRRLDLETESEALWRHRQGVSERQDFDPLELDRYSQLQQLSRGLLESASDLKDLRDAIAGRLQQMRSELLHQSHLHAELQEGLARAQMVPFSRLVPRLGKMVRQLAAELGKDVGLRVINPEVEIDRMVLERLITPLEHMLRNALDHGIETAEERLAQGKNPRACLTLQLQPQGSNLLLSVSDDGAGINVEQVLNKARSRGLIHSQQQLSHNEALQLIFLAGFSTAETITQISGRGVGMDVVHNEVQALGGTIEVNSSRGEGSRFELRLPYTLSTNRALMVRIGGELYALPLDTIEGVIRVSPYELEHYYQQPGSRYAYAGRDYRLRYLGSLLFGWNPPVLDGITRPLPVILVRSQGDAVALQVDALEGSSEIVAKALAPQFNQVPGIAGASLQGDEGAVIILDLPALLRVKPEGYVVDSSSAATRSSSGHTCLVVDDSVTMRKVTSRLLERQGYQVLMARDGVEALTMLNECRPDVMLLDVEMPRMDGFELLSRLRHQPGWEDLPTIMITSRTGAKHRERARELGITHYLGKPYREQELLLAIETLTSTSADLREQRSS